MPPLYELGPYHGLASVVTSSLGHDMMVATSSNHGSDEYHGKICI